MQEMTSEACSTAPLNTQKTLIDSRDGNTYTVARIKNQTNDTALCWMTQNLRLVGDRTLTMYDSDTIESFFLPASSVLDKNNDNPKQFSESDKYQTKVFYDNDTTYGAYYNWYTATAGTGDAAFMTPGASTPSSICPKGWGLPTGGSNGEFYQLLNGLAYNTAVSTPYNLVISGTVGDSQYMAQPNVQFGQLWTSTLINHSSLSEQVAYALSIDKTNKTVSPSSNNANRYSGLPVRCVAR